MLLSSPKWERSEHPVDIVERLAGHHEWRFDREHEDEIIIAVEGQWCSYDAAFTWLPQLEALHLSCAFNLKVPQRRRDEAAQLISRINEQLWIGHFDIWPSDGMIMFRHTMLLSGGAEPTAAQCEGLLVRALENCERYYQAFQFVVWAGKTAGEALIGTQLEPMGRA